ncbi:hypothetical protein SAMN05192553_102382 [Cyclobacterium xiamenense]|uniref:Uncharacterized protein n=1 Tax=Cyclobacterium xiamenense TaxID=1297121 RepID=A0A1H6VZE2_9BACT|nr:hypothetical protein [Cyclobacterium xiamenense]SEJ10051.1 hypothetical protein SAMN05192553_102382 [Cyclobacterium xiamenense]
MDLEKFDILKRNYEKFIQEAEKAINQESAKQQTRSVWFDRQTIEKLLAQTDPKQGGIKIYLGMYDERTVSERDDAERASDYIGKLTVVLTASNVNQDPGQETMIVNGGKVCPPDC